MDGSYWYVIELTYCCWKCNKDCKKLNMEILYILIPISLIFIAVIIYALFWAIRSDQYEDMEGPKHQILMDDDRISTDKDDNASH